MATLSNAMKLVAGTAISGALICATPSTIAVAQPAPANTTLVAGRCGIPAAEVRAALDAQGQYKMIVGNRMALAFDDQGRAIDSPRVANVFTSNANGTLGYELEGNRPLGTPSTEFCVAARYTNIRFNDWTRAGVPAFASVTTPDNATLEARCLDQSYTRGLRCNAASRVIETADRVDGFRVMMSAQAINENGQLARRMFVLGSPTAQNGHIEIVDSAGVGLGLAGLDRVAFTPEGEVMIRPAVASATAPANGRGTLLASAAPR